MSLIKKIVLPLFGLVLTAGLLREASTMASGTNTAAPTAVSASTEPRLLKAEGRVVAYPGAEVEVGTDVDGTVVRMLVEEKDVVRKGQLIAELRNDDLRAQIAEARARVAEADSDIALYEVEIDRARKLYDAEVGTKQALDRAQRDRDSARARRETILASVRHLDALVEKTRIYAPLNGTVMERHAETGEAISKGKAIVTIADLNKIRVEAEVDEFDAGRVTLNSSAKITAEGYLGEHWKGKVEEIPDAVTNRRLKPADPGRPTDTRVLLVKVAFSEANPLKLGQRVELELESGR
jgi:HlyD family secretion protein